MLISHRSRVAIAASCALVWACRSETPSDTLQSPQPPVGAAAPASREPPGSPEAAPRAGDSAQPPLALPYPRAAWRLAAPPALASVTLSFSQIVIRHAEARPEVSFNPAYWLSVSTPARSRAEAHALAEHVAEQAAADPTRFSDLARRHSEDLPSRDEGGALGNYAAIQLSPWPQVLDALSALKAGQTSKVVETAYGFHVFYRSQPPREEASSGAHVVIGHDRARWLSIYARGPRPSRTREQALALANDVWREAQAHPERFGELVHRYSEHRDAIAGGDFGAWSTREASPFPPRTKRLGELAVGQVGTPVETHLGFEIIQRTPARARSQYRAAMLAFPVATNPANAPVDPSPELRAEALHRAEAALRRLREGQRSLDGPDIGVEQWEEGRANPELTRALAQLQPGQITPEPVDTEFGFVIAQRLEPAPVEPEQHAMDLPVPGRGELREFLASLPPHDSLPFLRTFADNVAAELALEHETAQRLGMLHQMSGSVSGAEDLSHQFGDLLAHTGALLGGARYARYEAALSRDAAAHLLLATSELGPLGL
jgi:parvulin-like peptidyl-prolyl isomerase